MIPFSDLVKKELEKARKNHGKQSSIHEGYAVMLEEVWDIVKMKSSDRDMEHLLKELVQVASCAQKMAEDLVIPKVEEKRKKK